MDAFFVEAERRRDATLAEVAVVVGGLGPRGVVASASYEARERGVRSAMPISEARRRLPRARYLPPDHRYYTRVSHDVFAVLRSFTPHVEALSVDEAFLDVSGLRLHYETAGTVGEAIRQRLRDELGLPASVGVATTKFLAKLASDDAKPDGILVVTAGSELDYLHPLPVRRLWGVGAATHAALEQLAVVTIGDLARLDPVMLANRLGPANGAHLAALARGHDPREVVGAPDSKSISVEETYARDLADHDAVETALLELCSRLAHRLHAAGQGGRTMSLKVRYGDFTTVTRASTNQEALAHTGELWDAARLLLERVGPDQRGVRLLGVALSHLEDVASPRQLSITGDQRDRASGTAEEIRARYGAQAVVPARLVRKSSTKGEKGPNA